MRERKLLREWLDKHEPRPIQCIRHIHKHAYVVGYAAPQCLVVSLCWTEAEPQMKDFERACPLDIINRFDKELQAGDWCITGYVSFKKGGGEKIAIKIQDKEVVK